MKLITKQDAARRRLAHYRREDHNRNPLGFELHAAALAMPDDATMEQVDEMDASVRLQHRDCPIPVVEDHACTDCDAHVLPLVQIGTDPHYGDSTVFVCLPCLRRAVALAEEGT